MTQHYNRKIFNTVFYIDVFYPGSNRYKITETLREQWRPKLIRTPNFIPEVNKHEIDMHICIYMTFKTSKCTVFVSSFWFWCLRAYYANYTLLSEVVYRCGCFLISSSNVLKTIFLEHLYTIEKDSTVITRYSFKNYILACKISNQMHTNLEKKKYGNIV